MVAFLVSTFPFFLFTTSKQNKKGTPGTWGEGEVREA